MTNCFRSLYTQFYRFQRRKCLKNGKWISLTPFTCDIVARKQWRSSQMANEQNLMCTRIPGVHRQLDLTIPSAMHSAVNEMLFVRLQSVWRRPPHSTHHTNAFIIKSNQMLCEEKWIWKYQQSELNATLIKRFLLNRYSWCDSSIRIPTHSLTYNVNMLSRSVSLTMFIRIITSWWLLCLASSVIHAVCVCVCVASSHCSRIALDSIQFINNETVRATQPRAETKVGLPRRSYRNSSSLTNVHHEMKNGKRNENNED